MRAQVEETIEAIRPALQADGGDIFLREVDESTGVITVSLVGACGTCPASTRPRCTTASGTTSCT